MAATSSIDLDSDPKVMVGMRLLDAPRDLVWSVWTDPKHLARWWGPHGFTNPVCGWTSDPEAGSRLTWPVPTAPCIR